MKEANKIARHIIDVSGIDVFKNSRKREFVEVRSLLNVYAKTSLSNEV